MSTSCFARSLAGPPLLHFLQVANSSPDFLLVSFLSSSYTWGGWSAAHGHTPEIASFRDTICQVFPSICCGVRKRRTRDPGSPSPEFGGTSQAREARL